MLPNRAFPFPLLLLLNACASLPTPTAPAGSVITERHLTEDPTRTASFSDLLLLSLEHPDGGQPRHDVGTPGRDVVPYKTEKPSELTLVADTSEHEFRLALLDAQGATLAVAGDVPVTLTLAPGRYELVAEHPALGDRSADSEPGVIPLFVRPQSSTGSLQVTADDGSVSTLLATNSCSGCDLSGIDLTYGIFPRADFADTNFEGTVMVEMDLTDADMVRTVLVGVNLEGATLSGADLHDANLQEADLTDADLTDADLTGAQIGQVIFTNADLSGAQWVDGSLCAEGSIGSCLH